MRKETFTRRFNRLFQPTWTDVFCFLAALAIPTLLWFLMEIFSI